MRPRQYSLPHRQPTIKTLGGTVTCTRCQAKAQHGGQCLRPAMRGKAVCSTHGGKSQGPKTEAGRRRCAEARTVHGQETSAIRKEYREASARLAELEELAYDLGIMSGPRTRGRKPRGTRE